MKNLSQPEIAIRHLTIPLTTRKRPTLFFLLLIVGSCLITLPSPGFTSSAVIKNPSHARAFGLESLRKAVLKDGGVPLPEQLGQYVKNRRAAVALGKALFWDMQVGSDGVQACASCHFHAGADNRTRNQLSPNLSAVFDEYQGDVLGYVNALRVNNPNFEINSPNKKLKREDFPFVKTIQDIQRTPEGAILPGLGNSDDIGGSMGVFFTFFNGIDPGKPVDLGSPLLDPVWNVQQKTSVRRVEPRNTPSVINAVFNHTNFWDGRANPHFNGQSAFGDQDQSPLTFIAVNTPQGLTTQRISISNASLASQAVTPLTSPFEMSFGDFSQGNGRSLPEIAQKLMKTATATGKPITPLGQQLVHPLDSVLGRYSNAPWPGLKTSYEDLIKQAFVDDYWNSSEPLDFGTVSFTQMEYNFGLFFGLSVALYESTLVSDQTPFDKWMETNRFNRGFGPKELAGLNLFVNEGQCIKCHAGPELTQATIRSIKNGKNPIRAMAMAKGTALYDNGFYNISVTPTTDDLGRGEMDPFSQPLAFSRQSLFDRLKVLQANYPILGGETIPALDEDLQSSVCTDTNNNGVCENDEPLMPEFKRAAVDGAFKVPGLRNTLLTGPYFHNGGMATLKQVVQFYNRGGNFCQFNLNELNPSIKPLGLSSTQEQRLVDFLVSLTDDRVVYQKAPFDHPELRIPNDGLDKEGSKRIAATGFWGSGRHLHPFLKLDPQDAIFTPANICVHD